MNFDDAVENLTKVILDGRITLNGGVLTGREHIALQTSLKTLIDLANNEGKKEEAKELNKG